MPKNVQMPDGSVVAFPDTMDDATIHAEGLKYIQSKAPQVSDLNAPRPQIPLAPVTGQVNPSPAGDIRNRVIDMSRPIIAGGVGDVAGLGGGAVTGGFGTLPAYGGGYALTDALLQELKSKEGRPPDFGTALKEGVVQAGIQKLLSGLTAAGFRAGKSFNAADQPEIYNFLPTTSQAAAASGMPKLAMVAKAIEDLNLNAKKAALDRSGGAGFTEALKFARDSDFYRLDKGQVNFSMNPNTEVRLASQQLPFGEGSYTPIKITPGEDYQPLRKGKSFQLPTEPTIQAGTPKINAYDAANKIDAVIKDPDKLQDVLTAGQEVGINQNVRKTLAGYQFSKMMNDAVVERDLQGNVMRLDPKALNEAWTDPAMQDSLKKLYNAPTRANMEQFFKNIEMTQDKMQAPQMSKKLWLMRGGIGLSAGLLTGGLTGSGIAGTEATAAAYLTAPQVGRLLANPKVGRFIVNAAGGEPLGVSDIFVSKQIARALQGESIALVNADGSKTPVMVQDGKMVSIK